MRLPSSLSPTQINYFFSLMAKSLLSPRFYAQILKLPFMTSFKYFLALSCLYAAFSTLVLYINNARAIPRLILSLPSLSSHPPDHHFHPVQSTPEHRPGQDAPEFSPASSWLKKNPQPEPSNRLKNQQKAQVIEAPAEKIISFLKIAFPVFIVLSLLSFFVLAPLARLALLIPLALIILLLGRLFSLPLTYRQSYQLGLHLITLPTLGTMAAPLFGQNLSLASQLLLTLAFSSVVLFRLRKVLVY